MRISFRINENKDRDIYEALENCTDVTKQVKKLIRRGLLYNPYVIEKVIKELDDQPIKEKVIISKQEPVKPTKKETLAMEEQKDKESSIPQGDSSEIQEVVVFDMGETLTDTEDEEVIADDEESIDDEQITEEEVVDEQLEDEQSEDEQDSSPILDNLLKSFGQ